MTGKAISMMRLSELLDAWGGDPGRWPEAEREAALALCRSRPEAERLRRRALALDVALRELSPPPVPPPWLAERIVHRVPSVPSPWCWLGGWPTLAPIAALALAAGIGLGAQLGRYQPSLDPAEDWLALAGLTGSWSEESPELLP